VKFITQSKVEEIRSALINNSIGMGFSPFIKIIQFIDFSQTYSSVGAKYQ